MPPIWRPQRRAACACGSGRPFAGCCAVWEEAFQRLAARLVAFARTAELRGTAEDAAGVFEADAGRGPAGRRHTAASLRFVEWFLQDYEPEAGGGALLGAFADRAGKLSWHEEQLLLALLLAPWRAYEVSEMLGSGAVVARDLLVGAEGPAGPIGLPGSPIRSDLLVCRLLALGATRRPGLSVLRLPGPSREELLAYLRTAYQMARPSRHVSLEDFLDRSAHLYHHFFKARGQAMGAEAHETAPRAAYAPSRARYRARDQARIRAALARQSQVERQATDPQGRFAWMDAALGIPRAAVRIGAGTVEVSADTREALEEAQRFVEAVLRGLIELPGEMEAARPPAAAGGDGGGSGGVRGLAFLRRVVAAWPETPSVLLGGLTPREAARTRAGRHEVAEVLLGLERDMARQKRLGRAWADLAPVREALDLPAPPSPARRQSGD